MSDPHPLVPIDAGEWDCPKLGCIRFRDHWGPHLAEGEPEPPKPDEYV